MNRRFSDLTRPVLLICGVLLGFGFSLQAQEKSTSSVKDESYGLTPERYMPFGNYANPYREFFREPLLYRGHGRTLDAPDPATLGTIRIGFLGPIEKTVSVASGSASHEMVLGQAMLQGAQLAIAEANARGGFRDTQVPFELMIHNDNGLWGASGNEIIDMVYREKVWAILGSIDGANSHIAIRVALKCEVPVMNSGDTDPTFVETRIPWVFRCIADDRNMCYLLADFAYGKLKLKRVAALRANNRYGRISIDEFRDASTRLGRPFITELNYPVGAEDFSEALKLIRALEPDGVITFGNADESARILKQMRAMDLNCWYFGSDRLVSPQFTGKLNRRDLHHVAAGVPYNPNSQHVRFMAFQAAYQKAFNMEPDAYAAHAYDGMNMLLDAIQQAGLNRALIRDSLASMSTYQGVTGLKEFDHVFSNVSPAFLAIWEQGVVKYVSRDEMAELNLEP